MMWHQPVLLLILANCLFLVTEAENDFRGSQKKIRSAGDSTFQDKARGFLRNMRKKQTVAPVEQNVDDVTPNNDPVTQGEKLGNVRRRGDRNWGLDWMNYNRFGGQGNSSGWSNNGNKRTGEMDPVIKDIFSKLSIDKTKTVKRSGFSGYLKGLKEKKGDGKICGAPTKDVETCCASPKLITDASIMQTCIRKYSAKTENNNGENKQQNQADKVRCSMQCAFEAHGYLDANGTILTDKVIPALKKYATNDFWLKYIPEAVDACNKRLIAKKTKMSTGQVSKCPPDTKQFQTCIRQNFFVNCPLENFAFDKSCEELKKNIIACDPFSTVNTEKAKVNNPVNSGVKLSNKKIQHKNKQVASSNGQTGTVETTGNPKVPNIKHKLKRVKILVKTTVSPVVKVSAKIKGNIKKISKKL